MAEHPQRLDVIDELALQLKASAALIDPSRLGGATLTDEEWAETERMQANYSDFIKGSWHVVEPGTTFIPGYHIDAICEHLEACRRREIRNLVITMPPRFMKSTTVAVMFCPWVWITEPYAKFLFSAYAMNLSTRDSTQSRFLINSEWYQRRWGHIYRLTGDQNVKTEFKNTATGVRIATSVDAGATGKGGNFIVVDDPINARDAGSDAIRYAALEWWDKTMSTRMNDPKRDVRIVVMQRLHEKDVAGHVLEQGGWEHLNLPNEYEPTTHVTKIGWRDWRTNPGELLWPERFGEAETRAAKNVLQAYGYSAQYQQRPSPAGGGKFQGKWFKRVTEEDIPWDDITGIVRFWDLAATREEAGKDPDFTAGALVALTRDGRRYILDMKTLRDTPGAVEKLVTDTAVEDGPGVVIRMEQEPGSSGVITIYNYKKLLKEFDFEGVRSTGTKEARAYPVSQAAERGYNHNRDGVGDFIWHMLSASWNDSLVHQMEMFPFGAHDDELDAVSGAETYLAFSESRALGSLWSPRHHLVARSDFKRVVGQEEIPSAWKLGRAMNWDISALRRPAMVGVAVPDEGSALYGKVFVWLSHEFDQASTPRQAADGVRSLEGLNHLRATRYSFINPEATSEIETFVKHSLYFHPWDVDEMRGIAQLRNYLDVRKDEAHSFNIGPNGQPLAGDPQIYLLVDDNEVASAQTEHGGHRGLRQQIPGYYLSDVETGVPESGPLLNCLRALAANFFPAGEKMTGVERVRRDLEKRFPHLTDAAIRAQLDQLPEARQATLLQAREMYVDAELRREERRDRMGTTHIRASRSRR
jgi:predicted phage terminase large subunit-like protein